MRLRVSIATWLGIVLLAGCHKEQWDDCFTSYGVEGTERRMLDDFTRLEVSDNFEVVLLQDTTQTDYIELQGGKNMFKGVHTEVKNGVFKIKDRNTCKFVRDYNKRLTLRINTRHLNAIHLTAATDIRCEDTLTLNFLQIYHAALSDLELNINVDEIYVNTINSGSVKLSGVARVMKGSIEEVSDLDARNLLCKEVLLDSHTSWDCYINATELIYVRIYNTGNIFYENTPSGLLELNERKGKGMLVKKG